MSPMKLNTKLIGGFMIMGLLVLIGGLWGPIGISRLSSELKKVSEVHFPASTSLVNIIKTQRNIQKGTQSLLVPEAFSKESDKTSLLQGLEEGWSRAEKGLGYDSLPRTREGDTTWSNLKMAWAAWKKDHNTIIQFLKEGNRAEALALSRGQARDSAVTVEKLLRDLSDLNRKQSEETNKEAKTQGSWQKRLIVTGTAIGILMAMVFGFFLAGSITKPIYRTINNLSGTCDQFISTSGQIASSSHQLAGGTSTQAAAVEETSAVIEELSSKVQKNTEEINALQKINDEANLIGYATFEMFKQAKRATKEIKISSGETLKIVKTIGEIAFQTNLLALSASVEAAQSSEFKTGFSVVAQEVRNLALRSTEAAKNTSALIEETIKLINRGDDLMRKSVGSYIEYGTESAVIVPYSQKAMEVAQNQAQGLEQINSAIQEISRTAQNNASSAQESASAAQEINARAISMAKIVEELKQVVGGGRV
jgi:methyl-accepting chemotaxis protein